MESSGRQIQGQSIAELRQVFRSLFNRHSSTGPPPGRGYHPRLRTKINDMLMLLTQNHCQLRSGQRRCFSFNSSLAGGSHFSVIDPLVS